MAVRIDIGAGTAYAEAVAGGYTGTREQFRTDMGNSATNASAAADSAAAAAASAASVSPSNDDDIAYILFG